MRVMIGNGNTIDCDKKCPKVPIIIQGYTFSVDLFRLPIGGADMVLGVQWLKQLSPLRTDYSLLTMTFTYNDMLISLHANVPMHPSPASAQQVRRLAQTNSISALYHLTRVTTPTPLSTDTTPLSTDHTPTPLSTDTTPKLTKTTHPSLDLLLHQYQHLFLEPTQLPPPRTITHHIHLQPNTQPVNVRPYWYPFSQKNELERQVVAMLEVDMICHSHSPFSSLVLLVKKKDGN